jgi:predicted DNA-binding transcriptional regulator AlpA
MDDISATEIAKPLLTAEELALGTRLGTGRIYRWAAEGRFPAEFLFKVGRRTYFKRGLIEWLAGRNGTGPNT